MHPADDPIEIPELWPKGTLIKGDFVIDKRLGQGGFGTVYLARNRFLGTINVIKRLHAQYASDQEFKWKFVNEGRVMRRLRGCPHIVDIEQMTETEDRHLILVMEYVPGGDLETLMQARFLTVEEVIEFARQIAVGLQAAHQAGLIHRDIKPQNVLLGEDPATGNVQLKLIDFGIAADQMSQHQTSVMRGGSIGYAAPEQWLKAGKELDGRTDLYSLGATMYRMMTGQMPYPDVFDMGAFIGRTFEGPPRPVREVQPDVPVPLSQLIEELLAVKVEERPRDAGVVIARLAEMQRPVPVQTPTVVVMAPPKKTVVDSTPPPPVDRVTTPARPEDVPLPGALGQTRLGAVPETNRKGTGNWAKGMAAAGVLAAAVGSWRYFGIPSAKTQDSPPRRQSEARLNSSPTQKPTAIEMVRINLKDGLPYVLIPAGTFTMGCSPGDNECNADEKPAHEVHLTRDFRLGQTEVTQAAYFKVTDKSPSDFKDDDRRPMQVNWDEAKQYCEAIGGRLPTEAEWEYAARGGDKSARYGRLDEIAWYRENSPITTQPAGTLLLFEATAILALVVAVVEPTFFALLMAAIGGPALLLAGFVATSVTAVAMAAIAMLAEEEDTQAVTAIAGPLPENEFVPGCRLCRCRHGSNRRQPLRLDWTKSSHPWHARTCSGGFACPQGQVKSGTSPLVTAWSLRPLPPLCLTSLLQT